MSDFNDLMAELLELGLTASPVRPFTACIMDASGQILVTSCNAMHISPLYSAENLALHILASEYDCRPDFPLTLVSTAEPDDGSLMAWYWARSRGIQLTELVYGATREDIQGIWSDDPCRPLQTALEQFPAPFRDSLTVHAPVLREECREAFAGGAELALSGEAPVNSLDLAQYWMTGDWLMDEWDELLEE